MIYGNAISKSPDEKTDPIFSIFNNIKDMLPDRETSLWRTPIFSPKDWTPKFASTIFHTGTWIPCGSHFRKEKKTIPRHSSGIWKHKSVPQKSTFGKFNSPRESWRGDVILHGVMSQQPLHAVSLPACTRSHSSTLWSDVLFFLSFCRVPRLGTS